MTMAARCPGFDLPLDEVVVDRYRPVFEVPRQCGPAVQAVVGRASDLAAVKRAAVLGLQPNVQRLPQRPRQLIASLATSLVPVSSSNVRRACATHYAAMRFGYPR
jgi:hypothetical protein